MDGLADLEAENQRRDLGFRLLHMDIRGCPLEGAHGRPSQLRSLAALTFTSGHQAFIAQA
jgi:hypothetical protein